MENADFHYGFTTRLTPADVFDWLKNPGNWWVGLFGETIEGRSEKVGDRFSFRAGEGMHESHQELIELEAGKRITWLVTGSHLSFLEKPDEWAGTKIRFDIESDEGQTKVRFVHEGLVPQIECYGNCAPAWTQYMEHLRRALQ